MVISSQLILYRFKKICRSLRPLILVTDRQSEIINANLLFHSYVWSEDYRCPRIRWFGNAKGDMVIFVPRITWRGAVIDVKGSAVSRRRSEPPPEPKQSLRWPLNGDKCFDNGHPADSVEWILYTRRWRSANARRSWHARRLVLAFRSHCTPHHCNTTCYDPSSGPFRPPTAFVACSSLRRLS